MLKLALAYSFSLSSLKHNLMMSACFSSKICPSIAVVLSGCGVSDGTEIIEASAVLSHITRNKAIPFMFAPDKPQPETINHLFSEIDTSDCRNVLAESARIARGQVLPLSELIKTRERYDAVIFPGGYGVTKTLSNFSTRWSPCSTLLPDVATILKEFHSCKKPIGLCGISSLLGAKIINGITVTLGKKTCDKMNWPFQKAIQLAEEMGATVENKDVNETTFDPKNVVFSTPAYLYATAEYHQVYDGVGGMIKYIILTIKDQSC